MINTAETGHALRDNCISWTAVTGRTRNFADYSTRQRPDSIRNQNHFSSKTVTVLSHFTARKIQIFVFHIVIADEPISRIPCTLIAQSLTIIPLGPESLRDSSSLPEGCSQAWLSPLLRELRELSLTALGEPGRLSPPIWPCTTRGFPCLACCQTSGGLLPHLFTLTGKSASLRR
jgi:hypothetical protein